MSETTELHVAENASLDHQPPPPETQVDTTERQLTPRERMMAEIVQHAQDVREREEALGSVYDQEARSRGEVFRDESEEPAETPAETPPTAPVVAAPPVVAPAAPPPMRQVEVNGQTYTITDEQFAQLARVGAMALAQPPAAPPAVVEPPPAVRPLVDEAKLSETVNKMQFGSPEEARAALASLIHDVAAHTQPAAPQFDPQQIVAQATQQSLLAHQLIRDTETIKSEFPLIFTDPRLAALAQMTERALMQQDMAVGRVRPAIDIYREAGNQVYDLMKQPRPGSVAEQPNPALQAAPLVQREAGIEARKRAAPRNPQPVDRRAAQPAASRPPTSSEIIAQMRQRRGQAAL